MPTIRIDDEVFAALQERGRAFVDTPNDVLRRDYGLNGVNGTNVHAVPGTLSFPTGQQQQQPSSRPTRRRVMGRIQRGEKTPEPEFIVPILQALVEAGGRGRTSDIVDRVGQIMKDRLNEYDHKALATGEI